jgi:uncharacterized protein
MNKLALGTVQFGMDYGINSQAGKIPQKDVLNILKFAEENGINTLDTAFSYGDSEKIIGKFLKNNPGTNYNVISKLPNANKQSFEKYFKKSLINLHRNKIYGYLFHNFSNFLAEPELLDSMYMLKKKKLVNKIGFSIYFPADLEYLLKNNVKFDIVQVPYNFFDQRFSPYFPKLKEKNIELHVRSVFLQGLIFKKPSELSTNFLGIKKSLELLNSLSSVNKVMISSIALNFANLNKYIDKIIIGVDNLSNLKENLNNFKDSSIINKFYTDLENLSIDDEQIILPINWK